MIVCLLLLNTAWVAAQNPAIGARIWGINLFSACFSVILFTRISRLPGASPRRRVIGAIHDNVTLTAWLYTCGPLGALALFIYPFVTVGNGFRYGVRYLAWSGFLGALGIGVLVAAAPGWAEYGPIGAGVLISHIVVTVYTGVLLRRLYQTQAQLATLATRDVLTGLPNRRFFMDRLARMVVAPERRELACLYLDIDGFKAVNDCYGHKSGDELLHQVGAAVLGCIRTSDVLARVGGDEFTVILDGSANPDVGQAISDHARAVADRIITAIEGIRSVDGHPVDISVSIGIAVVTTGGVEMPVLPDELLKAADDAMYVAKRSGRGHSHFADRTPAPFMHSAAVVEGASVAPDGVEIAMGQIATRMAAHGAVMTG